MPFAWDGASTATVPVRGTAEIPFELVRIAAKKESPSVNLLNSSAIVTTIAEVTFYGRDQAGNAISVVAPESRSTSATLGTSKVVADALVKSLVMVALVALGACTVHDSVAPGLTGPSGPVGPLAGSPPSATFTVSPNPGAVGQPVQFDASSSTPGLDATSISSYNWLFGDGSSGSGRTVTHAYTGENSYTVRMTARRTIVGCPVPQRR